MQATGYDFDDPVDLLLFLDDDLLNGYYSLHPWQQQLLKDFAVPTTAKNPFQAVLRAANGSGKDSIIIAACVVWLCMKFPSSVCVVTSASGTQLDRQTNTAIDKLCRAANTKFGHEMWKINYRHYECRFPDNEGNIPKDEDTVEITRSTVELFATNEAGRAEGWHPKTYDGQLAIFASEAKTVTDDIFAAFTRCTGFTKRLDVSSPGLPMGHFFDRCTTSARTYRQGCGWTDHGRGGWDEYHITAYDCPHIPQQQIESARQQYGDGSALFKSMVLGEFGTTDEQTVVPYHLVWNAINNIKIPWVGESYNTAGLDLAAGGDENALVVRNGNKVVKVIGFRMDDTSRTIDHLEMLFKDNKLNHPEALIFGDAGGLGKPILDQLKRRGWHNIRYVLNQKAPYDKRAYYNRGAEMWFGFRKFLENGEIILCDDERTKRQLSTRYYKPAESNRLQLESKITARSKGHPSPDRADATVLAFSNYKSRFEDGVEKERLPIPPRPVPPEAVVGGFSLKEHAKRQAAPVDEYAKYYGSENGNDMRPNTEHLHQLVDEYNQRVRQRQLERTI